MAGERKGTTYEAIVMIVLEELVRRGKLAGTVLWNEAPDAIKVTPDFTVGATRNAPKQMLMVTHSGSEKESNRKFWRNVGEVAEAKTVLPQPPWVVSVLFDRAVKPDILLLGRSTFDAQVEVGNKAYGRALHKWVDDHAALLPADAREKARAIAEMVSGRGKHARELAAILRAFSSDLRKALEPGPSPQEPIWAGIRRMRFRAPAARATALRRGAGKLALMPSCMASPWPKIKLGKDDERVALALGFASRSVAGVVLTDPEILWVVRNMPQAEVAAALKVQPIDRMQVWAEPLRHLPELESYAQWVLDHWGDVTNTEALYGHLSQCADSPSSFGVVVPVGSRRVWLFHLLLDILKALSGQQTGYGLSALLADLRDLREDKAHRAVVAKIARAAGIRPPSWRDDRGISLGIGDWANGPSAQSFPLYPDDLARVVDALSRRLAAHSRTEAEKACRGLRDVVVATYLEVRFLTYRLFDPLGAIVARAVEAGGYSWKVCPVEPACFAQYAKAELGATLDPRAGGTEVLRASRTVINWQSAHDSHSNDKTKELCGRAAAIRYSWDRAGRTFVPRADTDRLLLIVDGTWVQQELDALARAGWDEIFYPDEMGKLVKAIV